MTKFDKTFGSKLWRLQNFYKIRDKKRQLTNLTFNRIQRRIIRQVAKEYEEYGKIRHYDLKYRQGGVSTFWLLWYLDDTVFNKNTISAILAHRRESLGYLWEIVRLAHSNMPDEFRPKLTDDSKVTLSFPNLSKLFISLRVQSTAVHNLHISEYCYCDPLDLEDTISAVPADANITLESTPNGINHGHETYMETKSGASQFKGMFHPWFIQEDYVAEVLGSNIVLTEEEKKMKSMALRDYRIKITHEQIMFRRLQQSNLKQLFRQNFPEDDITCFLTSGLNFFNLFKISALMEEAREWTDATPPVIDTDEITQWFKPVAGHMYVAGADPAEGVGGDYSVLTIMDVTDRKQVFRLRAQLGVDGFYQECDKWGRLYNNALMGIERRNHGHAVLLGLEQDKHYPNIYKEETRRPLIKKGGQTVNKKGKLGWDTNTQTRALLLDQLKLGMEGDFFEDEKNFEPDFHVLDKILLNEALTFVENSGKYEASPGKHDDVIFAWGICYQMAQVVNRRPQGLGKKYFIGGKLESSS